MELKGLLSHFNLDYNNLDYYVEAFTHSSSANELSSDINYERLEFLGDSLINFFVAEYLFSLNEQLSEGEMTIMRASYVREEALCNYAYSLGLDNVIIVGGSEKTLKNSIVADIVESFLGAIYIDLGMDCCKEFFLANILPIIKNTKIVFKVDYKTKLQELVQADKRTVVYKLIKESGKPHLKEFIYEVSMDEIKLGVGIGHTKKDAQQKAAESALNKLAK